MKRTTFALLVSLGALAGLGSAGCSWDVCEEAFGGPCPAPSGVGGAGGDGGSTTTTTTSSSTGGGGSGGGTTTTGLPMECDPLLLQPNQSLDPTCGLFVEPGAPTGDGSQAMPYGTLAEALAANPMNKPIYVCSTGQSLNEPTTLSASERLVGAVTCTDWKATTTKTAWTAGENQVVLTLSGTTNAHLQGFAITSANATGFDAADGDGNDSIAVIADGGVATLVGVDIVAGNGAAGGAGADQSGQAPGRQSDAASFDGNAGGGCGMAGGLAKSYALCPAGGTTSGGKGGDGDLAVGSPGNPGSPALGGGTSGNGDTGAGGWDCVANSGNGGAGFPGPAGNAGLAGTTTALVTITGLTGQPGGDGGNGTIGQGGGGGGGRKQGTCGGATPGPSGGSGGAGGCGGLAGQGGGQGGASIALLSLGAMLTLTDVTLTAGLGGAGGEGGDGQSGGIGGNGANGGVGGGLGACNGGQGGTGGAGGPGGGGAGGASLGLAYTGTAPELDDSAITVSATPAAGGAGGNANTSGNAGAVGLTAKKQAY